MPHKHQRRPFRRGAGPCLLAIGLDPHAPERGFAQLVSATYQHAGVVYG
jgi:hypothetical protein